MSPLLRIPVADVLLFEFPGELPDVAAAGDLVISFHVLHREEHIMLAAHVVEAEVHRRAVGVSAMTRGMYSFSLTSPELPFELFLIAF